MLGLKRCKRVGQTGVSMIELMVTIAVMAIIAGLSMPYLSDSFLNGQLNSLANRFVAGAQRARSEAIKRNVPVTMCVSTTSTTCTSGTDCACTAGNWHQGWIILVGTTRILAEPALDAGMSLTEASNTISLTFRPQGVGATASVFKLCRSNPVGKHERQINLTATGKASVTKTELGTCP